MKTLLQVRFAQHEKLGTVSTLTYIDAPDGVPVPVCLILEHPWRNNAHFVSCIPEGSYIVAPFESDNHPGTYHILDVPDRDEILQHIGNTLKDTKGCQMLGLAFGWFNLDLEFGVKESREGLARLVEVVGRENYHLIIVKGYGV